MARAGQVTDDEKRIERCKLMFFTKGITQIRTESGFTRTKRPFLPPGVDECQISVAQLTCKFVRRRVKNAQHTKAR